MSKKSVNDLVINGISYIRNRRNKPTFNAIFKFVIRENIDISECEFKNSMLNLIADGVIFNKSSPDKRESFCINNENSVFNNSIVSETSIIDTPVINSVEFETPTKETIENFSNINISQKQSEETDSMTPDSKRNFMLGSINSLIEEKITEAMSPFIDSLESLIHSYDELLKERVQSDTTNSKLVDENQKLKFLEANSKTMVSEITFLRSELKTKNEIIKLMITNNSVHAPTDIPNAEYKEPIQPQKSKNETNNQNNNFKEDTVKTLPSIEIIGDSILNNIEGKGISKHGNVKVTGFSGSTSGDLKHHAIPTINRKPDVLILHIGSNDLTKGGDTCANIETIISKVRKSSSHTKIVLSSLIIRKDKQYLEQQVGELNIKLQKLCEDNLIDMIDNSNVDESCLGAKKLHPNKKGKSFLANNFIRYISTL